MMMSVLNIPFGGLSFQKDLQLIQADATVTLHI